MIIIIIKYQNGLLSTTESVVATGLYGFQTMDLSKYHTIGLYSVLVYSSIDYN